MIKTSQCPTCGAPIPPTAERCPYCGQYLIQETGSGPRKGETLNGILFERRTEPNESAFSLSVPQGWILEGGILRANLMHQLVNAQSIEAKLDFRVKRDAIGSVMIRWCPDTKYIDMRASPAGMMGMFPPGSNYQGMIVSPIMPAHVFLTQVIFPWAHPEATQAQVLTQNNEPLLIEIYRRRMAALGIPAQFSYDGAIVTFTYVEAGQRYVEQAYSVIENMGPMAGGLWSNKDTILIRAPEGEAETWAPILHHIRESVKLSHRWLAQEIVNQEFLSQSFLNAQRASQARERRILEVQQHLQQIDSEIAHNRRMTNAEIHNDATLTLLDQEEFVNPYSNDIETGSNQWDYRWVTEDGKEYYTNSEDVDPNLASYMNRSDWKRTPIRPRYPDDNQN